MGRPVLAPPGTEPRIVEALRRAFTEAMHDPQLIADAARMDLEIDFASGEEVQALVERLYKTPPAVVARARAIAATN
jgi:tripartite-type tricarboxylate transporter receptor subunit TctC